MSSGRCSSGILTFARCDLTAQLTDWRRFNDVGFELQKKIRDMSNKELRMQDQYSNGPETRHDLLNEVVCAYISIFFSDATNLVYYIRGTRNVAMFCIDMSGTQTFNGAVLFATTHLTLKGLTQTGCGQVHAETTRAPNRLVKSKSPSEVNKWRYLLETGRAAWAKDDIDMDKLREAMETSRT